MTLIIAIMFMLGLDGSLKSAVAQTETMDECKKHIAMYTKTPPEGYRDFSGQCFEVKLNPERDARTAQN